LKTDISWLASGLFVYFFPENRDAELVIGDMITQHGDNSCFAQFAPSIIQQLKSAGWVVRKQRQRKIVSIENIYMELKEN
jgi:hypothetical protein